MTGTRPSTWAWVAVHLLYPLFPFLLEGFIRLAVDEWRLSFDTFRASTLAMSIGLVAIFVNQSLRTYIPQVADEMETDSIGGASMAFLIMAIGFFVLFGLLVLLNALVTGRRITSLTSLLRTFQGFVFGGWVIPIVTAVAAQRSFKLRASIR